MNNLGPSLDDLLHHEADDESVGHKLQDKITTINIQEKEEEIKRLAASRNLPYIDLVGFPIGPDAISTISQQHAQELKLVCFFNNGAEVRIGVVELNSAVEKFIAELAEDLHAQVIPYLISEHSFSKAIKIYDTLPAVREVASGVKISGEDLAAFEKQIRNFHDLNEHIQKTSLTEMVTLIVAAAIKSRASDIHIEAEETGIKVRYRIDGVLNDVAELRKDVWSQVISRIKQLSHLKINIADRPQDGRFSIILPKDKVDVRVSALPTAFGESVVMRLLMSSAEKFSFDDLGLRGRQFDVLLKEINRPNGMIITTGPTGSGKTTTLYAILKRLNNPDTKIITIEDPIEYELKGINQSQVDKNYTFAQGLKSIVRQDPDIIMVGEIRDLDTAEISIQAALTGHLVLSTIHTNDAFGAIPRFLSLGAKPFLLAPALNVAIGQRLVRRVCPNCKQEVQPAPADLEKAQKLLAELPEADKQEVDLNNLKFFQGTGCDACQGLGYKGRIGIYEIMPITKDIQQMISKGDLSEWDIKKLAADAGVITMAQDGILKAAEGITSLDEVFRVVE